ncbi:hypothetical protein Gohar_027076 [Gossypium harknessii]|uniref:Uncharacterized protein n=1 Tax=Gossypium harknessii TaxID=34285 RepID=A0A7J9HV37_9ROSI|nr:hypothetical protein [Gossypium harknessii]
MFAAEALVCVQAIRFGAESDFLRVEVEGDAFEHAGRQTNKVAHILANEGLIECVNTYLASSLSISIARAVEVDRQCGRGGQPGASSAGGQPIEIDLFAGWFTNQPENLGVTILFWSRSITAIVSRSSGANEIDEGANGYTEREVRAVINVPSRTLKIE